ncbi:unnamed protein product [Symbiodinium necroappetens]|uniref:Uncharacterized protein n=1 Tax=Symbiodinium necroappetens TaxID=1628268 RepID=A0A812SX25_9DINO|nr:unnamed protein product [Symbiodinium necroappetens]
MWGELVTQATSHWRDHLQWLGQPNNSQKCLKNDIGEPKLDVICYAANYYPHRSCLAGQDIVVESRHFVTLEEQLRGWPKLSVHLKIDALELRLKDRSGMCWSGWDPKCTDHDQQPCLTHRREFHRCSTLGFSGFGRVGAGINGSMFERDAADETKQMIAEGHAAILKVVRYSDDSASDAFEIFRKGVVRGSSTQSATLQELDQKSKILTFLAEFAKFRRPRRRQVANVCSILLKDASWKEAAEGLSEPLPEMEVHGDMREPRSRSSEVSVPASPSEALISLREAVEQLRRLDFENVEEEGRPEAKKSLQQFAQGLHLVREYHPAELQEIDRLLPKHPILRFLILAKEEFCREQALQALRQLLTTPQLSKWREALEDDRELLEAAMASRILSSGSPDGRSPISRSSRGSGSDYESAASDEELSQVPIRNHARWMWQDAGRGYGGPIGAGLARLNPARWSQLLPEDQVVDELCRFLGTGSEDRPVRLEVEANGRRKKIEVPNVREAVRLTNNPAEWDKVRTLDMEIHFGFGSAAELPQYKALSLQEKLTRQVSIMEALRKRFFCTGSTLEVYRQGQLRGLALRRAPASESFGKEGPPVYLPNGFSVTAFAVSYVHKELVDVRLD